MASFLCQNVSGFYLFLAECVNISASACLFCFRRHTFNKVFPWVLFNRHFHTLLEGMKVKPMVWKAIWQFLLTVSYIFLYFDPRILTCRSLSGAYTDTHTHTHTHTQNMCKDLLTTMLVKNIYTKKQVISKHISQNKEKIKINQYIHVTAYHTAIASKKL